MTNIIVCILIAFVLIAFNAFMVFAEFALIKVRSTRLKELALGGNAKAKKALKANQHVDDYLSSIQLGITLASLALGWVGEPSIGRLLDMAMPSIFPFFSEHARVIISFSIAFLIITSLHVIFGEQVPKLIAIKFPDKTMLWVSYPLEIFYKATYIFKSILVWAAYKVLKLIGIDPHSKEEQPSEEEIRMIFDDSQDSGQFSLDRSLMFENLFDFKGEVVQNIMTPRQNIIGLKEDSSWAEKFAVIKTRKFSRYPVFNNNIDDAKDYLMVKEISLDFLAQNAAPPVDKYKRPLLIMKPDTPVEVALKEFQNQRIHQALVKNESDKVIGLLTLEDVLEELVGEIRDENETTPKFMLSNVLLTNACIMDLQPHSKAAAYSELINKMHDTMPVFSAQNAKDIINNREKLVTYNIGKGVAIPHIRLSSLNAPVVSMGISKKGILFSETDKMPVKIFFLLLSPAKDYGAQLKLLAQISSLVSNKTVRSRLLKAQSGKEAAEIILAFENTIAL
ncbi:CBS domain containing-hemolysin-like protein/mannitol/fructose-specific phosphotransferase system IIA component (Ntr-type) [Elusimicrobium posterum]|uniref:CNNM domain-containing protein n=1 Tax=Elusimicrobium posterum TaxID=3116653 RepID=UPI003C759726